jgi:hypothetical protein
LSQEALAEHIIAHFESVATPIFVVYGESSQFPELIQLFRDHYAECPDTLDLFLDMGMNKRETPGKTFFEIVRQIVDFLLDKVPDPEAQSQLFQPFRMLTNLKEKTRTYDPDDQLAEFVRFTYYSCYPILGEVFTKRNQLIIIEFKGFETVAEWGKKIHNYILDSLLERAGGQNLRFVLFVQSTKKPSLFYGSDEESSRKKVTFHKLEDEPEPQEPVPNQFLLPEN